MVAKCCWRESNPEPYGKTELKTVIEEKKKKSKSKNEGLESKKKKKGKKMLNGELKFDPGQEKCRISLDSSFSNDSFTSATRWSQSFETECDHKLDIDSEVIDLTRYYYIYSFFKIAGFNSRLDMQH